MPKVTYDAARGLIQEAGSGIQFETTPFSPVQNLTGTQAGSDAAISAPGVYLFNVDFVHSASLPLASAYPGATVTVRAAYARAYALTGSAEAAGTKVFTDGTSRGSKLAFSAGVAVGDSVTLISDGKSYCVMARSGSISISGT